MNNMQIQNENYLQRRRPKFTSDWNLFVRAARAGNFGELGVWLWQQNFLKIHKIRAGRVRAQE